MLQVTTFTLKPRRGRKAKEHGPVYDVTSVLPKCQALGSPLCQALGSPLGSTHAGFGAFLDPFPRLEQAK